MLRTAALLILLLGIAVPAAAQFVETFSDGDVTAAPPWTGPAEHWTIVPDAGDFVLRTAGPARSDTLYLATASTVRFGSWSLRLRYDDALPSAFNQIRLYLTADRPDLPAAAGYVVQLGSSERDVRLYHHAGGPNGTRTLLGGSGADRLPDAGRWFTLAVTRRPADGWQIFLDGALLGTIASHTDPDPAATSFGLWVKHTSTRGAAFYFDDLVVDASPDGGTPPAPRILHAAYHARPPTVELDMSAPLSSPSVTPDAFRFTPTVAPFDLDLTEDAAGRPDRRIRVTWPAPLAERTYDVRIQGLTAQTGRPLADTTVRFEVVAPLPLPGAGSLIVNEIQFAPAAPVPEYVEVLNRSPAHVDLQDVALADARRTPAALVEMSMPLAPGGYAVLTEDTAAFRVAFPGIDALQPAAWPTLNNGGDTVYLLAPDGVIDSVAYAAAWQSGTGAIERKDPDGPSGWEGNWGTSFDPSGGTPGRANSVFAPDRTPPHPVFVEALPPRTVDVTWSESPDPASVTVEAFLLEGRAPESVALRAPTVTRLLFAGSIRGDRLQVRGVRDPGGNRMDDAEARVAYRPAPGELVVNELLPAPRSDPFDARPNQPEYVELTNVTGRALSLRGLALLGPVDENGAADTLYLPDRFLDLPPDGYAVVFAAPDTTGDPDGALALRRAFPALDTRAPGVRLLPVALASLRLNNSRDDVRLSGPDGHILDAVAYDDAWHTPGLADINGRSLERISARAPSNDPTNWGSSAAPDGGTPGTRNSLAGPAEAPSEPPAEAAGLHLQPSPFSPDYDGVDDRTAIGYRLAQPVSTVRVRVYDLAGRPVRTLLDGAPAGTEGTIFWDGFDDAGRALRIGVYVVHLEALNAAQGTLEAYRRPVVLARSLR